MTTEDADLPAPVKLEHQSSFVEGANETKLNEAMYRSQTISRQKSAGFGVDEEMKEEVVKGAFSEMFEYHVKNLVEFVDKRGTPQRKHQPDKLNDIVLYIQDETDFYQAWENVFRGEVPDYQNDEDGERYKAS